MKLLIVGSTGMLGGKMCEILGAGHEVIRTTSRGGQGTAALDITDLEGARALVAELGPDVVLNCAAYTAVDDCETESERAFAVNSVGAGNLAQAAEENGATLVHISTDYVFDGRLEGRGYHEDDATGPSSVYGASKLDGEKAVLRHSSRHLILRTCWLFGEGGRNFPDTILRLAAERGELDIVADQRGSPTYTGEVARQAARLLEAGECGIFHVSGDGSCSWFDLAKATVEEAGLDCDLRPTTTDRFPRPAPRPANSELDNRNLRLTIGDTTRPWREQLTEYLSRRGSN